MHVCVMRLIPDTASTVHHCPKLPTRQLLRWQPVTPASGTQRKCAELTVLGHSHYAKPCDAVQKLSAG